MPSSLFLQSAVTDPYPYYASMQEEQPVYWDEANRLWAIYGYSGCQLVLAHPGAHIPSFNENNIQGLNPRAQLITGHLARLSNLTQHTVARQVAMLVFQSLKKIDVKNLSIQLMHEGEMDWINCIGRQLPVKVLLEALAFNQADTHFILANIHQLAKITLAGKTDEQVKAINGMVEEVYSITEKHLLATGLLKPILALLYQQHQLESEQGMAACISNCIGLFIQAYDAGRGLLGSALLHYFSHDSCKVAANDPALLKAVIVETLRFDSPVQHTRRVAADTLIIENKTIEKDAVILLVLAAANRDPRQFSHPSAFNINRVNNHTHLGFGDAQHQCLASHFSVYLAEEAIRALLEQYPRVRLMEDTIAYEPLQHLRIPERLMIETGPSSN